MIFIDLSFRGTLFKSIKKNADINQNTLLMVDLQIK